MSREPTIKSKDSPVDEQQVIDYLRKHPDFFQRHEELMDGLVIHHPQSGNAISLIERQVAHLRDQRNNLEQQIRYFTHAARNNERLLQRFNALIVRLLDTDSLDESAQLIMEVLRQEFHTDAVTIAIHGITSECSDIRILDDAQCSQYHELFQSNEPLSGALRPDQSVWLFHDRSPDIASALVLPLFTHHDSATGLVGIGSVNPERFHHSMGAEFVTYLGEIISQLFLKQMR